MPFNGSGTFTPPGADFPAVTGTVISSSKYNNVVQDLANGLTNAVTRDGQSPALANLSMGGFKLTGMADGAGTGQALVWGQTTAARLGGNLDFSGSAVRITADFTNATVANRAAFQTSTVNGATAVMAIPNGTGTYAEFSVRGASDPTNATVGYLSCINGSEVRLLSGATGTGTQCPLSVYVNNAERARFTTGGKLLVNTTSDTTGMLQVAGSGTRASLGNEAATLPGSGTSTFAVRAQLSYGGGIALEDGNYCWGLWDVSGTLNIGNSTSGNAASVSSRLALFSNGNCAIGTTTDEGYKLRVVGTAAFGGAAAKWAVDSSGRWTNPDRTQPAFSANSGGAGYSFSSTFTLVTFGTEEFDQTASFASSVFTAPVTGLYEFSVWMALNNTSASAIESSELAFYKNGSIHATLGVASAQGTSNGDVYRQLSGTKLVQLTAGDTFAVYGRRLTSFGLNGSGHVFSGKLVA